MRKVYHSENFESFSKIAVSAMNYKPSELLLSEHPELLNRFRTNIFTTHATIFFDEKPSDDEEYILIYGLMNLKRTTKYVKRSYLKLTLDNLDSWKVLVPAANGSGALGEPLSSPIVISPKVGHSQTFMSFGYFDTENEAQNCLKYIKSKFVRCMLGILKITQHNPPDKWEYVPLQDFTAQSDIDWTKSVADIDRQLYQKYGLTQQEIDFIETKVKEMN